MKEDLSAELGSKLRVIPDFPVKGVSFKDITPLLSDTEAFHKAIEALSEECGKVEFDVIVAPESRGFIIGAVLAYVMGKVVDDLLATGGTILASIDMVERLGGIVSAAAFLIELTYIPGRANLGKRGYDVISLIKLSD